MTDTRLDILILGSGGAAAQAVIALREAGFTGRVGLAAETEGAVFNPMLGPYFLKGRIPFQDCFLHQEGFYRSYRVQLFPGSPVARLDPEKKTVRLDNGQRLGYRRCLVATGARPKVPPIPGLELSDRCLTWRDPTSTVALGLALDKALARTGKVAIVGGSLIGLKAAEICRHRGLEPTVIELAERILPDSAHPWIAKRLEALFAAQGVRIITGNPPQGLEDDGSRVALTLAHGRVLTADLCLLAAGVEPSLDFIDPAQVRIDQALVVDQEQRTSVPDLFAAGDACQYQDLLTGRPRWPGLWANACHQGRVAGLNLAGRKASFPGAVAQLVSPFFDLVFTQVGELVPDDERTRTWSLTEPGSGHQRTALLQFRDDRLTGFNLLGEFEEAPLLKELLVKRIPLDPVLLEEDEPSLAEALRRLNDVWAATTGQGPLGVLSLP